jgi:hypothetical protein
MKTSVIQNKGIERKKVTATTEQTRLFHHWYFAQIRKSDIEDFTDRSHCHQKTEQRPNGPGLNRHPLKRRWSKMTLNRRSCTGRLDSVSGRLLLQE